MLTSKMSISKMLTSKMLTFKLLKNWPHYDSPLPRKGFDVHRRC
jgi:hypothetical protein